MAQFNSKIGIHKIRLSSVDSTNNFAAKLINEGLCQHGSVIMAEKQTNGRGQRDSEWQSDDKLNLLTSFIFEFKKIQPPDFFLINAFVSIAIVDFLNEIGLDAEIKWPNDIMIGSKKICGILVENKLSGNVLSHTIAGFGININQINFHGLHAATSAQLELGREFNLDQTLNSLIGSFRKWEPIISSEIKRGHLRQMYHNNLFGLNELKDFQIGSNVVQGTIKGVSDHGDLRLEIEGEVSLFKNKEVVYL